MFQELSVKLEIYGVLSGPRFNKGIFCIISLNGCDGKFHGTSLPLHFYN